MQSQFSEINLDILTVERVFCFQIQNTLIIVIFNKSLSISAAARQSSTIGEIVNLMSVDANRVNQ